MESLIEQAARRLAQLRQAGAAMEPMPTAIAPDPAVPVAAPASAAEIATHSAAADATGAATHAATPATKDIAIDIADGLDEAGSLSRKVELDFAALALDGIVTPDARRSRIGDQYRVIKRPLIVNAKGQGASVLNHGNLIMVTSAVSGEGKTFTAINLAISIAAELDNTVMLVDADVARPSVLDTLKLPSGPGLLDLLEGKHKMSDVLLRTNINKLSILPSGTPHGHATELLASSAMRQLLNDMAERYSDRIIIFDSPPLLLTTESRVLATQMGQVVMVVRADRTLQADVQQALSTIEACPVRLMLLNRAGTGEGGGYGYSYDNGYGYGAAKSAQAT